MCSDYRSDSQMQDKLLLFEPLNIFFLPNSRHHSKQPRGLWCRQIIPFQHCLQTFGGVCSFLSQKVVKEAQVILSDWIVLLSQVAPEELEKSLTKRSFNTGRESVTKILTSAQAADGRDAFVKVTSHTHTHTHTLDLSLSKAKICIRHKCSSVWGCNARHKKTKSVGGWQLKRLTNSIPWRHWCSAVLSELSGHKMLILPLLYYFSQNNHRRINWSVEQVNIVTWFGTRSLRDLSSESHFYIPFIYHKVRDLSLDSS